jgi:hypothetical protein
LSKICKAHITVEDEGKFRCKECKKLFKAAPFVEKHISNKHAEVIGDRLEEVRISLSQVHCAASADPHLPVR